MHSEEPCTQLRELMCSPFYTLYVDTTCQLVVAYRTLQPFEDLAEIPECFREIERALSSITRARYRMLGDVRDGPSRNDAAYEKALGDERGRLLSGFRQTVALVRTAVGQLQIQRLARDEGRDVYVTASAEDAFAYLGIAPHEWARVNQPSWAAAPLS